MPATLLQVPFFVHPALAGAAVAAGCVPVIIHLINRRRHARVPWAAMTFLLAARRRSVRRLRLEHWMLMLARIAIIVLFGLALARPYLSSASILPSSSTRVLRVVVLDNSLSMNARRDAKASRFERARSYAAELIDAFPPADPVALIACAGPATAALTQPSFDRRFVRERLLAIQPTERVADVVGGLSLAIEMIEASQFPPTNRAVYVISDFPPSVWLNENQRQPTPAVAALRRLTQRVSNPGENVTLIPISADEIENVAVTSLLSDSSLIAVNRPARFTIKVTNFGRSTREDVVLQVVKQGEVIRREPLPALEPGGTETVAVTTLFGAPGTQLIEATVTGLRDDALIEDNARYLSVEVRDSVPVLLVDGRPGLSRLAGQAGFLATALAPKVTETDTVVLDPVIVTAPELSTEILSEYGMVALCNVNRLADETWKELHDYVASGGGLLIFLGELVDADHYNEFGFDGGAGIMPGSISAAHHVGENDALHIAYDALHHRQAGSAGWPSIVRDFDGHPQSGLFSAAVSAYLPMEIDRRRADVVLRYTDGQPAVVAFTSAGRKVVVVTTTANMDWTNLPAKGDYVSLMTSLAAYLVRQKGSQRNLFVGEFVREPLTARQTSMPLRVSFPTAPNPARSSGIESAVPTLVPGEHRHGLLASSLTLSHGPIEHAGGVSVSIGAVQRLFAVNVKTSESSLAALDQAALSTGLGVLVHVAAGPEADRPKIVRAGSSDLAPTLLCVVVALLLMEMWMAMRFGTVRGSTAPADIRNAGAR